MRRLVLVLMAVVAVFAVPLVAVSHSPPGGEVALVSAENVGLESNALASQRVVGTFCDEAITNSIQVFDSGNDYLVPAVVRGIESRNGCVATIAAAIRRGRDHRPIVPGAHFGEPTALADTRRMHASRHADNQKS